MKIRNPFKELTRFELLLWGASVLITAGSFIAGSQKDWLTLIASLIGVTALIFVARGDVLGQILTCVFALLYSIISVKFRYYGEMLTYMGMSAPIAALSVVSWIRNPYEKGKNEVKVAKLTPLKITFLFVLTAIVTGVFYFIMKALGTTNLAVSTVSVTTSFLASALMFMRSPYYALAYGANDIVLIVLWILATIENSVYLPMVMCFAVFLANDVYGFINWIRMRSRQVKN